MAYIDKQYHNLLYNIIREGYVYEDPNRKNIKRLEIPSYTFRHEFKNGFPAISTKKLNYNAVITELIWFLRGDTNIKYLIDNSVNIWNKDAYNYYLKHLTEYEKIKGYRSFNEFIKIIKENTLNELHYNYSVQNYVFGDLGPIYGKQWRDFGGIDQIKNLIQVLKDKPLGTEHIVSAWNPEEKFKMALPPCHYGFQIIVRPLSYLEINIMKQQIIFDVYHKDKSKCIESYLEEEYKKLPKYGFELHWNQRSVDIFLGLPFNIASYATLALIIEKLTGYKALAIQGDLKKVHLYDNSINAVKEQLGRDVNKYNNCELNIDTEEYKNNINIFINNLKPKDFKLNNYKSYSYIKVEMLERNE